MILETVRAALKDPGNAFRYFTNSSTEYRTKSLEDSILLEGKVTKKNVKISTLTEADSTLRIRTNARIKYLVEITTGDITFVVNSESIYDKLSEGDNVRVAYTRIEYTTIDYQLPDFRQKVTHQESRWVPKSIKKLTVY